MRELIKTCIVQKKAKAEEEFVRKMTTLILEEMDTLTPQERKHRLDAFEASTNAAIASSRARRRQP
jgi:hypothetical protein